MYIATQRLILRPFLDTDLDALCILLRNDEIKKTYMLPDFENEEHCRKLALRFQELSGREDRYVAGIFRDGQLVGFANDVEITPERVEMGYVIDPAFHNRGFATEALRGIITCLHGHGFREVVTGAFQENGASIRVMVKAGMAPLERADAIEYRGKLHKCVYYVAKMGEFC